MSVENWANPHIRTMDFQVAEDGKDKDGEKVFAGDTRPEKRDNLEYFGLEES